jgi:predicted ATPase
MREAVARALADEMWDDVDRTPIDYTGMAGAAIAAYLAALEAEGFVVVPRTATDAMVTAGTAEMDRDSGWGHPNASTARIWVEDVWQAMIDTALGKKGESDV